MSVTPADLKIIAASLNNNTQAAGGLPSSRVIADNVVNSLFTGITSTQLVAGGQDWRKVFVGPQNADSSALFGAGLYLTAPADSHVGYYALAATSFGDSLADLKAALSGPIDYRTGLRAYGSTRLTANAANGATTVSANILGGVTPMLTADTPLPGAIIPKVIYPGYSKSGVIPLVRKGDVIRISEGANSSEHIAVDISGIADMVSPATAVNEVTGIFDDTLLTVYETTPTAQLRVEFAPAGNVNVYIGQDEAAQTFNRFVDFTVSDPQTGYPIITIPSRYWYVSGYNFSVGSFFILDLTSPEFSDFTPSQVITVSPPLPRAYTAAASIASRMPLGDCAAYVASVYSQETWTGEWSDERIGAQPGANYDTAGHPIIVTNQGAITERFVFHFNSDTAGVLLGEKSGVIYTGTITAAIAPANPANGAPYLSIPAAGWGQGWGYDNAVRINVVSALAPVWLLRATQPGATSQSVTVTATVAGDIDQA